jgi:putative SOS response-associated peptidase YedK
MCGRFSLTLTAGQLSYAFPWLRVPQQVEPRYNIAPSQPVAVVANSNRDELDFFQWGLVPSWAKDPSIGNRMINARAETLAEKPSFRVAYRRRRCLILADGFYEWQPDPNRGAKIPYYLRLASSEPFAFAGLWEDWHAPDGSRLLSCTIITTRPNELVAPIHNRMPAILSADDYDLWLSPEDEPAQRLQPLLGPYPAGDMIAYPVSRVVNNPANDVPECVLRASP